MPKRHTVTVEGFMGEEFETPLASSTGYGNKKRLSLAVALPDRTVEFVVYLGSVSFRFDTLEEAVTYYNNEGNFDD